MLLLPLWGVNAWPLLGAFAVAGPWIQVLGRLRCLVNGCCHGKAAPEDQGIRYWHPQTRPCRIAGLQGTAIFPTPTYSILWNLFTGPVLFRLWVVGASLPLIAGLYLILNGLGRFVEEEYRGEPQTPMMGGLPIYQWMAVASVAAGAILTTLRTDTAPGPPGWSWFALAGAAIFGLLAWLAMGVDFPQVNRRFARLA
jgi:prolipoprotein diacylglyceryltransferase